MAGRDKGIFSVSLNLASCSQLQVILQTYNLSPPNSCNNDKEKLLEILQCSKRFCKDFTGRTFEKISATFSKQGKLLQLSSIDSQVSLSVKQTDTPSPCTTCGVEVMDGTDQNGQGLLCTNCECWFHNQCNPTPLSDELFEKLADSPNFLKVFCPMCMLDNYVSNRKLHAEFQSLKLEVLEMKKNLDPSNMINTIAEKVLDKSTIEAHCEDLQQAMSSVSESAVEMKQGLNNTLASVENVADQMIQSKEQMNNSTIQNLSNLINASLNDLSSKLNSGIILNDAAVQKLSQNIASQVAKSCLLSTPDNSKNQPSPYSHMHSGTQLPLYSEKLQSQSKNPASNTSKTEAPVDNTPQAAQQCIAPNHSRNIGTPTRHKLLCDESKTIAIENIINYNKFVKHAKDTKKEFNTFHSGVKIVHSKGTRRGTLLIELEKEEDAKLIAQQWDPACFSTDNGVNNKTKATLLKDKNCKGVIYNIDHSYTEKFIADEIKKAGLKMEVKARRFMKGPKTMSTVMITFGCKEDLEQALSNGLRIGRSPEDVHRYKPTPSVIRCYNCFKFDHTKVWCTKKTKCCQYCSQNHEIKDCLILKAGDKSQYVCVNCEEGHHHSLSKDCPAYKDKLAQAIQYSEL